MVANSLSNLREITAVAIDIGDCDSDSCRGQRELSRFRTLAAKCPRLASRCVSFDSQSIDWCKLCEILARMTAAMRKITVNLPEAELEAAMKLTGKGVTLTLLEGLRELERSAKRSALRKLRGKVDFDLSLTETRN
jgi:hypothetical protein